VTDAKLHGFEERFADVKGVRMRYFVAGEGHPLLLVHGLGGAASNWTELAPLLLPRRRLLVPDLPGHGGSTALPGVSGLDPFADRVAAVAEREGMLPAPVVGHSLGGMVVLRLALRRPEAVQALVLAGAAGLSIGNVWGRQLLSVFTAVRPGRIAARYRSLVSRSRLLRRFVFGFVSVADPVGLTPGKRCGVTIRVRSSKRFAAPSSSCGARTTYSCHLPTRSNTHGACTRGSE
jgi:pimeloyl-ACP methyl ester carboxylesterase